MKKCHACKATGLKVGTIQECVKVSNRTFCANVEALVCSCGEATVSIQMLKQFELQVAFRLVQLGDSSGASCKFIRKSLGLDRESLASLLMTSEDLIERWEKEDGLIQAAPFAILGFLVDDELEDDDWTRKRLQSYRKPSTNCDEVFLGEIDSGT